MQNNWHNLPNCTTFCKPRYDDMARYDCSGNGTKVCRKNWYGSSCTRYCKATNGSLGHYTCTKDGHRICNNNWHNLPNCTTFCKPRYDDMARYDCSGNGTKVCRKNWYGSSCTRYCKATNGSLGHYTCTKDGHRICNNNWHNLPNCTTFCKPRYDDMARYDCSGNGTKVCRENWYGSSCTRYCKATNGSLGHYTCTKDGHRICNNNWHNLPNCTTFCKPRYDDMARYDCSGNGTKVCRENWYGSSCTRYCKATNGSLGHYTCTKDGHRICNNNWHNLPNCTTFCKPQDDSKGHYLCSRNGSMICMNNWYLPPVCNRHCIPKGNDREGHFNCSEAGEPVCHENWFSTDTGVCNLHCQAKRSAALGYYNCSQNGSRACLDNWYGLNCTIYCKESRTYTCNEQGGRICNKNYFGESCTIFCFPEDSAKGHYACNKTDGSRICMAHWTGKYCNLTRGTVSSSPLTSGAAEGNRSTPFSITDYTSSSTLEIDSQSTLSALSFGYSLVVLKSTVLSIISASQTTSLPSHQTTYKQSSIHAVTSSFETPGDYSTTKNFATKSSNYIPIANTKRFSVILTSHSSDSHLPSSRLSSLSSRSTIPTESLPDFKPSLYVSSHRLATSRLSETLASLPNHSTVKPSSSSKGHGVSSKIHSFLSSPVKGSAMGIPKETDSTTSPTSIKDFLAHSSRLQTSSTPATTVERRDSTLPFQRSTPSLDVPISSTMHNQSSQSYNGFVHSSRSWPSSSEASLVSESVAPSFTPPTSNRGSGSENLEWLMNSNEGRAILYGGGSTLLIIILVAMALVLYTRWAVPVRIAISILSCKIYFNIQWEPT